MVGMCLTCSSKKRFEQKEREVAQLLQFCRSSMLPFMQSRSEPSTRHPSLIGRTLQQESVIPALKCGGCPLARRSTALSRERQAKEKLEQLMETILHMEEPRQSNLVRQLERVVGRMYPRTYRAFYQTLQQQQ